MKMLYVSIFTTLSIVNVFASNPPVSILKSPEELAKAKESITPRCPKQISLKTIVDIKNNGHVEIEGHVYYPVNKSEFDKAAPANWQKLTLKDNAILEKDASFDVDLQGFVCYYRYKTFSGYEYELELRDAGPLIK